MSTLRGLAVRWRWICVVAFGALVGGGLMTLSPWAVFGPVVPAVEDTASSGQLLVYLLALWGVGFLTVGTVPVGGPKGEQQIGQFVASFLGRLTLLIVAVLWVDLQITRIAEVEKVPVWNYWLLIIVYTMGAFVFGLILMWLICLTFGRPQPQQPGRCKCHSSGKCFLRSGPESVGS